MGIVGNVSLMQSVCFHGHAWLSKYNFRLPYFVNTINICLMLSYVNFELNYLCNSKKVLISMSI